MAKIHIPANRLGRLERYDLANVQQALLVNGTLPVPSAWWDNIGVYEDPDGYANCSRGAP